MNGYLKIQELKPDYSFTAVRMLDTIPVTVFKASIPEQYQNVKHINVSPVYDTFTEEGSNYFVGSSPEGVSLKQILDASKFTLAEESAKFILLQVCQGLKAIHQAGLAYGYLHPENIIITNQGIIKLHFFEPSANIHKPESEESSTIDIWHIGQLLLEIAPSLSTKFLSRNPKERPSIDEAIQFFQEGIPLPFKTDSPEDLPNNQLESEGLFAVLLKKHGIENIKNIILPRTSQSITFFPGSEFSFGKGTILTDCNPSDQDKWIQFSFQNDSYLITSYRIKSHAYNFLKIWELHGSLDGINWFILDQQDTNALCTPQKEALFPIKNGQKVFHIKLIMKGPNSSGTYGFQLCGIEFYIQ